MKNVIPASSSLLNKLREGDRVALSRAISRIEEGDQGLAHLIRSAPPAKEASVLRVGIAGAAGVGKSSLISQLISHARADSHDVSVYCVDPSNSKHGGAILADRIRMSRHLSDCGVYIRSAGTRGYRGGLTRHTRDIVMLMGLAGFNIVLVESTGIGQSDIEIKEVVDIVVLLLAPESGDHIQFIKSGIMEIADIIVVNKCDRPGADILVNEIRFANSISTAKRPTVILADSISGSGSLALYRCIIGNSNNPTDQT